MRTLITAIFLFPATLACNNRNTSDGIMEKIDSVNNTLKRANESVHKSSSDLYDAVVRKYGESKLQQFYYHVSDCKGYLDDLKFRFNIFCGDSTGQLLPEARLDDMESTNIFFIEMGNGKILLNQLLKMRELFLQHTQNSDLRQQIEQLGDVPFDKEKKGFVQTYFYMTPPVAALTIISKFENDINIFENKILQEYLSK